LREVVFPLLDKIIGIWPFVFQCIRSQNIFYRLSEFDELFFELDAVWKLLIVGPEMHEWKVLRETDGERFVVRK
jgi:hypothetical protein